MLLPPLVPALAATWLGRLLDEPVVPPAPAPVPFSVSVCVFSVSGTAFFLSPYWSDCSLILSTLRSELTTTCALLSPSVLSRSAWRLAVFMALYLASAAVLFGRPSVPPLPSPLGHSIVPLPSVIVTLEALRLGTAEATRLAMPLTDAGSMPDPSLGRSTAAVAGCDSSAKRLSWPSVRLTRAPSPPLIWPIVLAISPSRPRW